MSVEHPNSALAGLRFRARNADAALDVALREADEQLPDRTAAEVSSWGLEIVTAGQAFLAACSGDARGRGLDG